MTALQALGLGSLQWLAEQFRNGRLQVPPHPSELKEAFKHEAPTLAAYFGRLAADGMNRQGFVALLDAVLEARRDQVRRYWPVLSGLGDGFGARLSQPVLDESFAQAEERVWLSSYNLGAGVHRNVLKGLVARMAEVSDLDVRIFLDIHILFQRDRHRDGSLKDRLAAVGRYLRGQWPGDAKPRFFYDKRGLDGADSCLHAKTTLIDRKRILVTSANLSRQAQERNLEAGLLVEDPHLCDAFAYLFQELIEENALIEL